MNIRDKIIKRLIASQFSGWSHGSVEEQRTRQERSVRYFRLPKNIQVTPLTVASISAEWIEIPDSDSRVILYLHGGAYTLGSINTHREWISRIALTTKIRCLAINYRLAPEFPFPAALEDTLNAYQWLLDQGHDASQVIFAGDSAGGGLALAALIKLRDSKRRTPAGAVCISPWTDLTLSGASIQTRIDLDPILDLESLTMCARYYAGEHDLIDPLISPFYADLKYLPPLFIQVGEDEILLDDAVRLAEKAQAAGVNVTLKVFKKMFHVFQLIPFLPESKLALEQIEAFFNQITLQTPK
jgi:acetyl esterase/lipase